jgi:glutathione S-transferase
VIRLYRIPRSTNVERVTLALAHKGLAVESVDVDPDDRSVVKAVSGQERVPVLEDGGTIVADSSTIIRYLEDRYPDRPVFPRERRARAGVEIFVDWFDEHWKRRLLRGLLEEIVYADNGRDERTVTALRAGMRRSHELLDALLDGHEFLFGAFSAADCAAFPFVKFALILDDDDKHPVHLLLRDEQQFGDAHPNVAAWIRRVDGLPRA